MQIRKENPKRSFLQRLQKISFNNELSKELEKVVDWADFEDRTLKVINKHAPNKRKTIRANHKPYITKELRKAIMDKTRLAKKRFNSDEDMDKFKKQKNFVDRESKRAIQGVMCLDS